MHYVRASLALMAAGCGRLEFSSVSPGGDAHTDTGGDGRPCVAVGHDEDGDGFDDACDLCPQRADSQVDSDGDGIGDACDLHPTAQTRTLFDPFRTALPAWS